MERILRRMETGYGREQDIPLLQDIGGKMLFRSFCALADGAVSPVDSSIKFFRDEYEDHVRLGRCPLKEPPPNGHRTDQVSEGGPAGREPVAWAAAPGPDLEVDEVLG
jgi:NADH-quinone oxidoreductase subunit F